MADPTTTWSLSPYLRVPDADAAIAFYQQAFGAQLVTAVPDPEGKLKMHVELNLNGARLYFADRRIMGGGADPSPDDAPVVLHLNVPDAVGAANRAIAAGCVERNKVEEQFWGDIYGQVTDPYGFVWAFLTPGKPKTQAEMAEAMKAMSR